MSLWSDSIKEVGRGAHSARALDYDQAKALFMAMLAGDVPDLELGALLLAYRIKGESAVELRAFSDALQVFLPAWHQPSAQYRPVILPCYNGTRKMANLLPILARKLAQLGVPVLLHGYAHSASGRHTAVPILQAMGYFLPQTLDEAFEQLSQQCLSFVPIDLLSPALGRLLALRERLGVRHTGHTLAKCIDPFALHGGAVRVVAPTHPDYAERYSQLLTEQSAHALLLKATEGEAFAHPSRNESWQIFKAGVVSVFDNKSTDNLASLDNQFELSAQEANAFAQYGLPTLDVIPLTLRLQVHLCQSLAALS